MLLKNLLINDIFQIHFKITSSNKSFTIVVLISANHNNSGYHHRPYFNKTVAAYISY